MPELVPQPTRVPVRGGKVINEYVDRVSVGSGALSVAMMESPPGWSEPPPTPEFDEVTLVLVGEVHVEHRDGTLVAKAGQAVLCRAGERVRYSTPGGADYVAICLPAFDADMVHREGDGDVRTSEAGSPA